MSKAANGSGEPVVPNRIKATALAEAPATVVGVDQSDGFSWIRVFDVVFAGLLLLAALPFLLLIAAAVKLTSPGPVLYGSERIGHTRSTFSAWKFRSMRPNADLILAETLRGDDALRAEYEEFNKLRDDPRLTVIGPAIRKTSIDELPQLWNVIKGDMSIVGPRPKLPHESHYYGAMLPLVLSVKPGLTGLWQVSGRNNLTMDERVNIDVEYVLGRSARGDLGIILRTFAVLCRPTKYGAA